VRSSKVKKIYRNVITQHYVDVTERGLSCDGRKAQR